MTRCYALYRVPGKIYHRLRELNISIYARIRDRATKYNFFEMYYRTLKEKVLFPLSAVHVSNGVIEAAQITMQIVFIGDLKKKV